MSGGILEVGHLESRRLTTIGTSLAIFGVKPSLATLTLQESFSKVHLVSFDLFRNLNRDRDTGIARE